MNAKHFDQLETRDPAARERAQFAMLPGLVQRAMAEAPGWMQHLDAVEPSSVTSRGELARLPLLRKASLKDLQARRPPFGGFAISERSTLARIFMSPGPIYEPEGSGDDWWRSARALHAAGFRSGDVVLNTFSYHLTPGGWILDAGLKALGCAVIPAGPANTEQQIEAIAHLKPTAYVGVPDFLKILLDKAREAGKPASSINKALVSGGALFPSLRQEYRQRGISVFQAYAIADAGVIAYESPSLEGMIVDEGVLIEIVRPGTGDPVPDGEVGEVVVTAFNRDYPMIRLATGDLSAVLAGTSPCGRTNMRIKGWLGRADQSTKVKGMFVHPEQIAEIGKRHPELGRMRLVVGRTGEVDSMTLKAETASHAVVSATAVTETLADITKIKGEVQLVPPGSLPNDGKVIADDRSYG
jgi:phenylacetate-CoA ligase